MVVAATKASQNQKQPVKTMAIHVGSTARYIREMHGLKQREAAQQLGVSVVHVCNVERGKSSPSSDLLDRYRELWGIDLYVLAWCLHGDINRLPEAVREPMKG